MEVVVLADMTELTESTEDTVNISGVNRRGAILNRCIFVVLPWSDVCGWMCANS